MEETKPDWKSRFTAEQLEKKRRVDRANQRRNRHKTKRRADELESALSMILDGDQNALIARLMKENTQLRVRLARQHDKIQSMITIGQECLDEHTEDDMSADEGATTLTETKRPARKKVDPNRSDPRVPRAASRVAPLVGRQISILYQVTTLHKTTCTSAPTAFFTVNDLVESIMAWRIDRGYGPGYKFIIEYFEMTETWPASSLFADLERHIGPDDFFRRIASAILFRSELSEPSRAHGYKKGAAARKEGSMDYQRRAICYCAYLLVSKWQSLFRSNLEFVAQFWVMWRYLLFLTFPTEDNLRQCPQWLWPTMDQCAHEHPGHIDFLVWPQLRSTLAKTWRSYDLPRLVTDLVVHYEMSVVNMSRMTPLIEVAPDDSGLVINSNFADQIFDSASFSLNSTFYQSYPELADCTAEVNLRQCLSSEGSLPAVLLVNNYSDMFKDGGMPMLAEGSGSIDPFQSFSFSSLIPVPFRGHSTFGASETLWTDLDGMAASDFDHGAVSSGRSLNSALHGGST